MILSRMYRACQGLLRRCGVRTLSSPPTSIKSHLPKRTVVRQLPISRYPTYEFADYSGWIFRLEGLSKSGIEEDQSPTTFGFNRERTSEVSVTDTIEQWKFLCIYLKNGNVDEDISPLGFKPLTGLDGLAKISAFSDSMV